MPSPRPLIALLLIAAAAPAQDAPNRFEFARDHVLGTSMKLVVTAPDAATAERAERAVVAEIERLAAILSSYAADSEVSRFAASSGPQTVSADLATVLAACDTWRTASDGAFAPGVEAIARLWRDAEKTGKEPTAAALAAAVAQLEAPLWQLDSAATPPRATRVGAVPFRIDGLAKGYVLDRATAYALDEIPSVTGLLLDVGGDVRARGYGSWTVGVQDPLATADNAPPAYQVTLGDRAIATSAGYARGFQVGDTHHSHILDPHTGRPVTGVRSATVVADDAVTADALATILNVLSPDAGIALVGKTPGADCLIVAADGSERTTRGFDALATRTAPRPAATSAPAASTWPDDFAFAVDFTIGTDDGDGGGARRGGYRRPYVAVWIEDTDGHPVRTLCLWIQRTRWLPDLRRWSKLYRGDDAFVETISRATRKQGEYQLTWDGLDDRGAAVPAGAYVLHVEAAREHGTYQLMKQPITIGTEPFEHDIAGNAEIGKAHVHFGKPGSPR